MCEKALTDQIYLAIGLKDRNGPIFKSGALMVGADAIYRVDESENWKLTEVISMDQVIEEQEESKDAATEQNENEDGFKFVESVFEI